LESGGKFWGCLGIAGELGDWVGIEEMGQGDSFLWEISARLEGLWGFKKLFLNQFAANRKTQTFKLL
jgi:hypothetical protein